MTGAAGVNYDVLDRFKVGAQKAAERTYGNIEHLGLKVVRESLGESAFMICGIEKYPIIASVEEGLGTKIIVTDKMSSYSGKAYFYWDIAQDAAAMIINDLITTGAIPITLAMHLAIGSSDWLKNPEKNSALVAGWKEACDIAGCAWSGGETPELKGIINEGTAVISGSAQGVIKEPAKMILAKNIKAGDLIVMIGSSGIHANGLTSARKIADNLPDGYLTRLDDGRTYGESLLDSTVIYAPMMLELIDKIDIHYAINITGHGWRKLMRAPQPFTYVIEQIPEPQPIFRFIVAESKISPREAYATFNMGAGFALYVGENDAQDVIVAANRQGLKAMIAGYIEEGEKKVLIKPLNIEFGEDELKIR